MRKKIIFIGGIHGVGKGTFCREVSSKMNILWFSASDLLKWSEISTNDNKLVEDFDETQSRLLKGIEKNVPDEKASLLDGHFCLLNTNGLPDKIDERVFYKINPIAIFVMVEEIEEIKKRLESRDNKLYRLKTLFEMQELEIVQSQKISKHLEIPFEFIRNREEEKLVKLIKQQL